MLSDNAFQVNVNFVFPHSIREIEQRYSTKISVSKTHQHGIVNGYGQHEGWIISIYAITDVCTYCGELRSNIGNVSQSERCSRHRWAARSRAILLFHAMGDTFDDAIQQADEQAKQFLENPINWGWEIEMFLTRAEFLQYTNGFQRKIDELRSENKKLILQIKDLETKE
jgi:hypothetical protein